MAVSTDPTDAPQQRGPMTDGGDAGAWEPYESMISLHDIVDDDTQGEVVRSWLDDERENITVLGHNGWYCVEVRQNGDRTDYTFRSETRPVRWIRSRACEA